MKATVKQIPAIVSGLRKRFDERRTRPLSWRLAQLDGMLAMLQERGEAITDALRADLGKPALEAYVAEVAYTRGEVDLFRKKLRVWTRPERVPTPIVTQPGRSMVVKEPLGVVLIISPWNYPFQLAMGPLIGAVAAGNCVVIKPSEMAEATSAVLAELVPKYLDDSCIKVVEGAVPETTALLAQPFDHIFFTGSTAVGRLVMAAAAKHPAPVTLELGGKSPCIVDQHTDITVTARRIVWGKFYNAGQTCVAPDHILVHRHRHDELLRALKKTIQEFYGPDPRRSPDYGRIINAHHHQRLMKLLGSGEVVVGGQADAQERYIAPTVLKNVTEDAPIMGEEIFGPILPVLKIDSVEAAIRFVNARPKALALYLFSSKKENQRKVIENTSSGAVTINHTWLHLTVRDLPFGGVGESGMGAYHGRSTFETFTHRKSVLEKPTSLDVPVMYPPYTEAKQKLLKTLL